MILKIDAQEYKVPLSRTIDMLRLLFMQLNSQEGIILDNGHVYRITRNGVFRTGLKALITPIVIPFLQRMYEEKGLTLEKPAKHVDLIDYTVNSFLDYIVLTEENFNALLTTRTNEDSSKTVISLIATFKESEYTEGELTAATSKND